MTKKVDVFDCDCSSPDHLIAIHKFYFSEDEDWKPMLDNAQMMFYHNNNIKNIFNEIKNFFNYVILSKEILIEGIIISNQEQEELNNLERFKISLEEILKHQKAEEENKTDINLTENNNSVKCECSSQDHLFVFEELNDNMLEIALIYNNKKNFFSRMIIGLKMLLGKNFQCEGGIDLIEPRSRYFVNTIVNYVNQQKSTKHEY